MDSPNRITKSRIGRKGSIPPVASKPSSDLPQPSWKTSTSTPYAAATESRLSSTALTAMTSDLNVTSIKTNASRSTNAEHQWGRGAHLSIEVPGLGRHSGDGDLGLRPGSPLLWARVVAKSVQGRVGGSVAAVAGDRDGDHGDRARWVDAHADRLVHHPRFPRQRRSALRFIALVPPASRRRRP